MKKLLIIGIILINFSCQEKCMKDNLSQTIEAYIDDFNSDYPNLNFKVAIKIYPDNSEISYSSYRIYASTLLLDETEIPNAVDVYKDKSILYFTKSITDNNQISDIKSTLKEQKLYLLDSVPRTSNFKEWIVFKKKSDDCSFLIKDTKYKELSHILGSIVK